MIRVATVVFDAPGATLDLYARSAGGMAAMYAELLGLRLRPRAALLREAGYPADEGDEVDPLVLSDDSTHPGMAFECETGDYRAPAWPDPDRPQQVHLDVAVPDLGTAHESVTRDGATLLREVGTHRVYVDCVGHPFCLYPGGASTVGRIERVVFDCFSPRTLAAFYGELLDMPVRVVDEPERVEIARREGQGPSLPSSTRCHPRRDGRIPPTRSSSTSTLTPTTPTRPHSWLRGWARSVSRTWAADSCTPTRRGIRSASVSSPLRRRLAAGEWWLSP